MTRVKRFEKTIQVQTSDLDENDHVNNVQYLQWVQDIAKAHWEHEAKKEWIDQYVWVALSHHIEYKKPAFLDDELILRTFIDSFDGVKSHRIVEIRKSENEDLICKCKTIWVMLDRGSNRPTRCPKDMVEAFYELIE